MCLLSVLLSFILRIHWWQREDPIVFQGCKKKKLITCRDQGWVFTSQQRCWQLEGYGALPSIIWRKIKARTFYPAKLFIRCEGRIMTLSDIQVFQEPAGGRWFTEIKRVSQERKLQVKQEIGDPAWKRQRKFLEAVCGKSQLCSQNVSADSGSDFFPKVELIEYLIKIWLKFGTLTTEKYIKY